MVTWYVLFAPFGEDEPILPKKKIRWVGSTTKQYLYYINILELAKYSKSTWNLQSSWNSQVNLDRFVHSCWVYGAYCCNRVKIVIDWDLWVSSNVHSCRQPTTISHVFVDARPPHRIMRESGHTVHLSTISWFGEMMNLRSLTLFESIVTKNQLKWLKYLEKIEKGELPGLIKGFPKSPHDIHHWSIGFWGSKLEIQWSPKAAGCEWFKSCWNNMLCL